MSDQKPVIIDLANLKVMFYSQIEILAQIKSMITTNNQIILANNEIIKHIGENTEYVIKWLQHLESNSTLPDDPKISYYE